MFKLSLKTFFSFIKKLAIISFLAISYVNCGLLSGGLTGSLGLGGSYGASQGYSSAPIGPVLAAVHSKRTYELRPVQSNYDAPIPQVIEVDSVEQPVQVIYRSISSPVFAQQIHTPGAPGQIESTNSEEEPHKLVHEVYKPVIQEVREVIQPLRRIVQEVKPVLEEVHTVVAKGELRPKAAIAPIPYEAPLPVEAPLPAPVLQETPVLNEGYGYKKAKKA